MTVLYTTPGLRGVGDALFVSAVARVLKQRCGVSPVAVHSVRHALFLNSPDVDFIVCGFDDTQRFVSVAPRETCWLPQIVGYRWSYNWFVRHSGVLGRSWNAHHGDPPSKPLLLETAEACGLQLSAEEQAGLRPWFFPYRHEIERWANTRDAICIQSTAATYYTPNKQWPVERWRAVAEALKGRYLVVQLGEPDDVPLPCDLDLRGKTDIRAAGAILAGARLFIGMEGGLMHLAHAVDTRSVIVYTGFITPEFSSYQENENLFRPEAGRQVPCWRRDPCNCACGLQVTVEDVLAAVARSLRQPVAPKHWIQ